MTTAQELGTLTKVNIKEVWPKEDANFTPWLSENISALGDAIGLELEAEETEAPVGDFSLDIHAREIDSNRPVVIENQFGKTDHDHFGKLLTYAAGFDANVMIWIAEEFRDEHRAALDLINARTGEDTLAFGVAIEAWRIDDSRPAPNFKVVAAPNEWRKHSNPLKQLSPLKERYAAFWNSLIGDFDSVEQGFMSKSKGGNKNNWQGFASGFAGMHYSAAFSNQGPRVELVLERDKEFNKRMFDSLRKRQEQIEAKLGALSWERLDTATRCRISRYTTGAIDGSNEELAAIRKWMADNLVAFKKAFTPILEDVMEELVTP